MDHREKLDWARKHLDALKAELDEFFRTPRYQITINPEPALPHYAVHLSHVDPPRPEWSLRIGDILHNARSALDSIIHHLSVRNERRALTEGEALQVQFPIVMAPKDWKAECTRRLRHVSPAVRTIAEGVQPYGSPKKLGGIPHHELALLRTASNVDKHRRIILVLAAATAFRVGLRGPGVPPATILTHGFRGPFEIGAQVGGWTYPGPDLTTDPHMHVYAEGTVTIQGAVGSALEGIRITDYFVTLLPFIERNIFSPLEALPCIF